MFWADWDWGKIGNEEKFGCGRKEKGLSGSPCVQKCLKRGKKGKRIEEEIKRSDTLKEYNLAHRTDRKRALSLREGCL